MKKQVIAGLIVAGVLAGCAGVQQQSFKLSDGRTVDYIHGKVDADGQTGVFRDAYIDGTPVISHFGAGPSLAGQLLQGAASSALIAGGAVGAAAVLRPTKINDADTTNLNNAQGQVQGQVQGQAALSHAEANPVSVQSTKVRNTSVNANSNSNSNHNRNNNSNSNSNKAGGKDNHGGGHGED